MSLLLCNNLAQAAGILLMKTQGRQHDEGQIFFLAGVDDVRFKRTVEPGDQLQITIDVLRARERLWKVRGTATVADTVACEGTLMIAQDSSQ